MIQEIVFCHNVGRDFATAGTTTAAVVVVVAAASDRCLHGERGRHLVVRASPTVLDRERRQIK